MTVAVPETDAVRASDSRPLRILYSFPDTLGAPGIGVAARHHTEQLARLGHEVHVYCTAVAGTRPGRAPARHDADARRPTSPPPRPRPSARVPLPRPPRRLGAASCRRADRRRPCLAARDARQRGRRPAHGRADDPRGAQHPHGVRLRARRRGEREAGPHGGGRPFARGHRGCAPPGGARVRGGGHGRRPLPVCPPDLPRPRLRRRSARDARLRVRPGQLPGAQAT